VLALPVLRLLRAEASMSRTAAAIFAAWIIVPAAFLTRHYACGPTSHAAVCTVFVLAVHHWFIYLQAALTCLAGMAAWLCIKLALRATGRPKIWAGAGWTAAAVCGTAVFWLRPIDASMRQRALDLASSFDWNAYVWVAHHTAPKDLFVTELPDKSLNPASLAVMAAGRSSVALPETYSNPYVDWESRNRRSLQYLAAARGPAENANPKLCELIGEAGDGAKAYVILPNAQAVSAKALRPDSVGLTNTIYRAMPAACAAIAGL
jgi:hypothetical protein